MRRFLRIVLPAIVILAWLAFAGVGGQAFGKIANVSTNDQVSFLPASADATKVQQEQSKFSKPAGAPAVIVVARSSGLTASDTHWVSSIRDAVSAQSGVQGVSPAIPSKDGQAVELIASLTPSADTSTVVAAMRTDLAKQTPSGLTAAVTGPAGFTADLTDAFAGIDGILLGVALLAVLVILVIVYRSPLLPFLVLGTAMFALTGAILVVYELAKAGVVTVNGQVQGILSILVIGAATDYALLYTARYREALRDARTGWEATKIALRGSFEPILASGGTVIAGVLCLLLSDLNSNKALGPVAAVGIVFSLLAALTLLPALLLAFRRAAFWPLRPTFGSKHPAVTGPEARGLWAAVGRLVSRHFRIVWVVCTIALLAGASGLFGLRANGVQQSDLVIGHSQARDGQAVLAKHFPGGSGSPALILGNANKLDALVAAAKQTKGIDSVVGVSKDSPTGTVPVGASASGSSGSGSAGGAGSAGGSGSASGSGSAGGSGSAAGAGGSGGASGAGGSGMSGSPTVVNGQVLLQATLSKPADSPAAEQTVRDLRTAVARADPGAKVGGVTAIAIDTNDTGIRDRSVIIPVVLAVILVILMLLLRSIVAPLVLIGSVILSFGAALGVGALVFDGVFHFPGADPSVPLYGFVFLVALGVDYNIFLMTRVREETLLHGPREGVIRGLGLTGGVITSAGVVLAATFAALAVIPILFLVQIAFIVAFGVLLDTIVVRSLLVPAVIYDLNRRAWWPSRISRGHPAHEG
ncbi:MMPL family transporter [Curtobacterium ammoniigenes]|uniref:MMPL family transporter n=1 Tax=Curtobacterium ammoniigenes TaxID=395387 RepID=UPI00082DD1C1|nr:efflux RND transporter permease subunit [Curtobacterium ammoniigenes]